ncbi:hypothetical protein [Demetria terragena]|uniref:hypothetical protein n=1 Tax=Demetria terragena TaxID=63959 RepID=UPI000366A088|nr:hypothetical protein [Demetria terragena]
MRTRTLSAITVAGLATAGFATSAPAEAATSINMGKVVLAAQWDPAKAGSSIVDGAGPSVKAVEQKLAAKKLLDSKYVDGHFGTTTITAYAKWQKSLGYSGLAASGLPGKTSLEKLGLTVTNTISVGAKTTVDGKTVNTRTKNMLAAAEKKAGNLPLTQGSYNPGGVGASAGTHDGGGALDISVRNISDKTAAVKALRQVGFAAWLRTTAQGFDPHIHAIAVNDTDMSPSAQDQVGDYYEGRNGLASGAADDGPKVTKVIWEDVK